MADTWIRATILGLLIGVSLPVSLRAEESGSGEIEAVVAEGSTLSATAESRSEHAVGVQAFRTVVQEALTDNPGVRKSRAELTSAMEEKPQAIAAFLPDLTMSASKTHARTYYDDGHTESDPGVVSLSLSQTLFSQAAIEAYRLVEPTIASAREAVRASEQSIILSIASAAIGYLQAKEVADLAENNIRVTQRHLEATEARYGVGEITRTDVSQAKARLAAAHAEGIQARNDVDLSRATFLETAGVTPPESLTVPDIGSDLVDDSLEDLMRRVEQRPDVQSAIHALRMAETSIDVQWAGHLPTLSLSGSAGRSWNQRVAGRHDPVDDYSVGVTLSVPVFAGGETVSLTRQARADRDAQQAALDALYRQAAREIKEAVLNHRSAVASADAFETAVEANADAMDGVEQEFQVGTRTALDVLDAQNELFRSQTDLARSRYSVQLARFSLLSALGALSPEALGLPRP
ncbi:MAG: TolC family outer membrane protein [Magnetococcales bacterium]|nr:TolC family outer membrane protein [Magnetococcales bacterium]